MVYILGNKRPVGAVLLSCGLWQRRRLRNTRRRCKANYVSSVIKARTMTNLTAAFQGQGTRWLASERKEERDDGHADADKRALESRWRASQGGALPKRERPRATVSSCLAANPATAPSQQRSRKEVEFQTPSSSAPRLYQRESQMFHP